MTFSCSGLGLFFYCFKNHSYLLCAGKFSRQNICAIMTHPWGTQWKEVDISSCGVISWSTWWPLKQKKITGPPGVVGQSIELLVCYWGSAILIFGSFSKWRLSILWSFLLFWDTWRNKSLKPVSGRARRFLAFLSLWSPYKWKWLIFHRVLLFKTM